MLDWRKETTSKEGSRGWANRLAPLPGRERSRKKGEREERLGRKDEPFKLGVGSSSDGKVLGFDGGGAVDG